MLLPSILKGPDMPKHMAINLGEPNSWVIKNEEDTSKILDLACKKALEILEFQIKKDIPVLTLMIKTDKGNEDYATKIITAISNDELLTENKVRVYVVGDWYTENIELIESIKKVMDKTKDYDKYFLNICINYEGQKEILTALKLLVKKALVDKISVDELKLEDIKDNLSTSYFIPPELIFETQNSYSGLLLWDSKNSVIYYSEKKFLELDKGDFEKSVDYLNKLKKKN